MFKSLILDLWILFIKEDFFFKFLYISGLALEISDLLSALLIGLFSSVFSLLVNNGPSDFNLSVLDPSVFYVLSVYIATN